jgi:hypothetical protein
MKTSIITRVIAITLLALTSGCVTSRTIYVQLPPEVRLPTASLPDFEIYLVNTPNAQAAFKIVDMVATRHGLVLDAASPSKLNHGAGLARFYRKQVKGRWLWCETVSATGCKIYLRPESNRLEIQVEADSSPPADFWQMYDELQVRLREK